MTRRFAATIAAPLLAAAVAAPLAASPAAAAAPLAPPPAAAVESMLMEIRSIPTLKRTITVKEPLVRIGDLLENAGPLAGVPVFRAPDIGTTGTVSTSQIMEALRPYRMFRVDLGDIAEVEVTRAGRVFSSAEIQNRILQAYSGQYGLGEAASLSLTIERDVRAFAVEASSSGELVVARSSYDPRTTRFDITFEVPGSQAARRVPLRFTGTLVEMVETVVAARSLQRGDVIKATDVIVERRPRAEVPTDAAAPGERVAGLAVRQQLRSGQPIRRHDLMKPDLVKRDDTVTLIFEAPGLFLTTRGKALEAGAEGDTVTAVNLQSKRTVQGVVSGPGQIRLVSATPRVVAAAALPPSAPARSAPKSGE
ncbi:flagellar basal body P-ring formation chaperone FlgA [Rhodoplanes sp. TEM]|uniref:Flagellar basal body P-ring formation chaperone FlgA n=1 Tax=Rhodoplanes tepidamans TaxID=200616 RepID=A0ABT5J7B8_RHOTP|nr:MULTISPECIES: flagellar basal body P-ring formation chaperone FlgA [Rhodoplanes]MDC7785550.1 flagellar basal body P-ring formation chaperone FlgA [Rhodoplanes tepidamans]MDC7986168.1 flagellar basal body P-ring formation chaperone FlgA [Rhodoplanes sp. TEM]MDQ0353280.1 flagella basal body P-ring formation protein FlgA [Rhodoplanes tepidamans]